MDLVKTSALTTSLIAALSLAACSGEDSTQANNTSTTPSQSHNDHAHDHTPGETHDHHDHAHGEEVPLGTFNLGDLTVEAAQGHGNIEPGKELHLVIKLPYSDNGNSTVRAWIGTDDRLASIVAKGDYAASHDDYDIHAIAPDTLPENTMWWIEVTKPDGEKLTGSIAPK